MSFTNHAQIFEGVSHSVGELRVIIKERGQMAGVRVEAHHSFLDLPHEVISTLQTLHPHLTN